LVDRAQQKGKHAEEAEAGQEGIAIDRPLHQQMIGSLSCSKSQRYLMVCWLLKPKDAKLTWKHSSYPQCHPCRCLCTP